MKSISDHQQNLVAYLQGGMLVSFDHQAHSNANQDGTTHNYWECSQVKVSTFPDRNEIIGAVVSEGYERVYAEAIADEVLSQTTE